MSAGLSLAYFSSSKLMSVVVVSIAVLISLSRIFVGAHFPTDVLGGMIIAVGLFSLFSMVLWPTLRDRIPEKPNFSNIFFRIAFWSELLAAVFALFIYAPFVAEYPPVAAVVAVAVLTFLGYRYRKVRLLPS
jgi:undecaprenyl-diphosphatase